MAMDRNIIWSNNCIGKFNNAYMFYWLCRMHADRRVSHIWNFLKFDHEKGEHDRSRACVKRALVKEQLKILGAQLLDARSIVNWYSLALPQWGTLDLVVHRFFWLVEEGSIGNRSNCATVRDS